MVQPDGTADGLEGHQVDGMTIQQILSSPNPQWSIRPAELTARDKAFTAAWNSGLSYAQCERIADRMEAREAVREQQEARQ